eukprot:366078-Chlamydomonas_euryale.AAC.6
MVRARARVACSSACTTTPPHMAERTTVPSASPNHALDVAHAPMQLMYPMLHSTIKDVASRTGLDNMSLRPCLEISITTGYAATVSQP